jgi:hypothetical protein
MPEDALRQKQPRNPVTMRRGELLNMFNPFNPMFTTDSRDPIRTVSASNLERFQQASPSLACTVCCLSVVEVPLSCGDAVRELCALGILSLQQHRQVKRNLRGAVGASAAVTRLFWVHDGTEVHRRGSRRRWLRQHATAQPAPRSRPHATASAIRRESPSLRPPPRHRARQQCADGDAVASGHVHHRASASAAGARSPDSSPPSLLHSDRAQKRASGTAHARERGRMENCPACGGGGARHNAQDAWSRSFRLHEVRTIPCAPTAACGFVGCRGLALVLAERSSNRGMG